MTPKVSIILPTFNRMKFLPAAISSIKCQLCQEWELIIIDDGSDDDTISVASDLTRDISERVMIITQINCGPGIARNNGIKASRGAYIAFFDSDDTWEEGHLSVCLEVLDRNPDVDWVYSSFRRTNLLTKSIIDPDEFHRNGVSAPFLSLKTETRGNLQVISDSRALSCMIEHGLCVGLRASVVRRRVFDVVQFPNSRIGEDQALYIHALCRGVRFGYLQSIQATAFVHDSNISDVSGQNTVARSVAVQLELIESLKSLLKVPMTSAEQRILSRRIAGVCFWNVGYVYATRGMYQAALRYMRQGIFWYPRDFRLWKTYVLTAFRWMIQRGKSAKSTGAS